jgi:hypothetical protein
MHGANSDAPDQPKSGEIERGQKAGIQDRVGASEQQGSQQAARDCNKSGKVQSDSHDAAPQSRANAGEVGGTVQERPAEGSTVPVQNVSVVSETKAAETAPTESAQVDSEVVATADPAAEEPGVSTSTVSLAVSANDSRSEARWSLPPWAVVLALCRGPVGLIAG